MEHHVLSAAVFQAGKDKVRDKELWKAYMKQTLVLKPSLTLKDCRLLAQGFVSPELRWRSFGPLFEAVSDQVRHLVGEAKSLRLDLCLSVNAFAKVRVTDVGLFSSVGDVVVNRKGSDLNHIDYGALLNAFASCQRPHTRLCAFVTDTAHVEWEQWDTKSLAIALTALANLKYRPSESFLQQATRLVTERAQEFTAANLSGALFGLSRLLGTSLPSTLVEAVEPVVRHPDYFLGHPTDLAYFCASIEPSQLSPDTRDMVIATARRELSSLSCSQLAMIFDFANGSCPEDFYEQVPLVIGSANWKELAVFARCGNITTWPSVLKRALKMTELPDANSLSWVLLRGGRDTRTAALVPLICKIEWTQATADRALDALMSLRCNHAEALTTLGGKTKSSPLGSRPQAARALAKLGVYQENHGGDVLISALQNERTHNLDPVLQASGSSFSSSKQLHLPRMSKEMMTPTSSKDDDISELVYRQSLGESIPNAVKPWDKGVDRGSGFLRDVHGALVRAGLKPRARIPCGAFVVDLISSSSSSNVVDSTSPSFTSERAEEPNIVNEEHATVCNNSDSEPRTTTRDKVAWLLEVPHCFFLGTQDSTPMQELKRRVLRYQFTVISVPYWEWPTSESEQDEYISSRCEQHCKR